MANDDKVKVVETGKEYELLVADLVPSSGEDERTWYNQTAGMLDKLLFPTASYFLVQLNYIVFVASP